MDRGVAHLPPPRPLRCPRRRPSLCTTLASPAAPGPCPVPAAASSPAPPDVHTLSAPQKHVHFCS
ncbi:hypothetical protein GHT09_007935 [Marmota monax]|uniref:Uncharacterized protein n=1 Tax=Marmota monax TaxID=9995 RepID=A0A834V246_MARMO|nr:hypothetical protein GHT09_007935 [Marmota monax]